MKRQRCQWVTDDPLYIAYHDEEWGRPVFDDQKLFEMLSLEGAQAGLSWLTILKRRKNYKSAFAQFDPQKIATFTENDVQQLMKNKGIIRHERKIRSVLTNAQAFLTVQKEFGSFHEYVWSFVGGEPIINHWEQADEIPNATEISETLSKDLKKRGFTFIGPVICYAFMQAIGMVNDHTKDCFLYEAGVEKKASSP